MLTTTILPQSWAYELEQLRDEIFAEQRAIRGDFSIQDAAKCALAAFSGLEGYAASWDLDANTAMAAVYAPIFADAPEYEPDPQPPVPNAAQIRKASYQLLQGVKPVRDGKSWLVPSGSRTTVVHRIEDGHCSCEAGCNNRPCWHLAIVELPAVKRAA